ncbi:zinc-binding dehydrogenase [Patescibacteria group bacterium]|nr:zinc-binding dehydrogenase [Patescibacteria group bacterium]
MKAFVLKSYSSKPQLSNIPIPTPTRDEVLVKVAYCGVNQADLKIFSQNYGNSISFPLTMGSEIVGTLNGEKRVAIHPYFACGKCTYCQKGASIFCKTPWKLFGVHKNGGYAQYVAVPKKSIIPIPSSLSFPDACALTLSAGTAFRMVTVLADIKKGDWVAVTAAASGVGIYSTQLAKYMGGNVIVLAGDDKKLGVLKSFGIKHLINYQSANFQAKIMDITGDHGIDTLIDTVGGVLFESLLPLVSKEGTTVFCGATAGKDIRINMADMYYRQKKLIGSSGFTSAELRNIFHLVVKNKVKPVIDSIFPIEELPKAWDRLRKRQVFGKILIKI